VFLLGTQPLAGPVCTGLEAASGPLGRSSAGKVADRLGTNSVEKLADPEGRNSVGMNGLAAERKTGRWSAEGMLHRLQ
jgi:hypothetical protein